jgi:23S rRNA pseudouridine2605 synthase
MLVRLQKFIADAGVASRRASEVLIQEGRVNVNGRSVTALGTKVDPLHDKVTVEGRQIKPKRKLYLALHKPKGFVCSRQDPIGRRTVGDLLPKEWNNLYSVGRLDYASEGLILFTNDGDFSLRVSHPRYGIRKRYLVTIKGPIELLQMQPLTKGVFDEGEKLQAQSARILKSTSGHSLLELVLAEGKNREVRRMFEVLGFTVERLQRVQIGPVKLGELPLGKWRTLTEPEINSLLKGHAPDAKGSSQ